MKWTQELTEYKEQIHLMTKKIIEEHFPADLFLFELIWSNLWASICQLKDQDPREWKIEDLRLASSSDFSYPSEVANKELKAILLTFASVVSDLIAAKKNLSRVEVEDIVNTYIEQYLPPKSMHQDIISTFIKTSGNAESTSNPEMGEPPSPLPQEEEKKEYKVYSHEFPQGEPISNGEFERIMDDYRNGSEYLFLIYQQKETGFYYSEICKTKIDQREIRALKYFIKNPNTLISYNKIYAEGVLGVRDFEGPLADKHYKNIYTMIKVLRKKTSRKMKLFLITIRGNGYKFVTEDFPKFFLFELLPIQV